LGPGGCQRLNKRDVAVIEVGWRLQHFTQCSQERSGSLAVTPREAHIVRLNRRQFLGVA